jgi:lysophospholipase L1-like esterase
LLSSPRLSGKYGEALAAMIKAGRARPLLLVNWTYDAALYANPEVERPAHTADIRAAHDRLAAIANLREIRVSQVWERVRRDHPEIQLTEDGNHPSVAGSYLVALAVYASISRRSVAGATYVPAGLSEADAASIRRIVEMS